MMYQCIICKANTMDCRRGEITFVDGTLLVVYFCDECREKYSDEEIYKIIVRKTFH